MNLAARYTAVARIITAFHHPVAQTTRTAMVAVPAIRIVQVIRVGEAEEAVGVAEAEVAEAEEGAEPQHHLSAPAASGRTMKLWDYLAA
jgi:hypothetical protein